MLDIDFEKNIFGAYTGFQYDVLILPSDGAWEPARNVNLRDMMSIGVLNFPSAMTFAKY